MRLTHRRAPMLVVVLLALASLSPRADAAARDVAAGTGYDVSNFQCGSTLPAVPQFAVIEVEGAPYNRTTSATCLTAQYAYAAAAPLAPQFYVYASDTANRGGSNSITAQCGSAPTAQCAHDYAAGAAEDAVLSVDAAGLPVTPTTWWVDVECATSACADWQAGPLGMPVNQAAIKGYVDGLRTRPERVSTVGFYSTAYQWGHITGQTNASPAFGVEGMPVWYASGAATPAAGAAKYCGTVGFTGGPISLVQSAPQPVTSDPDSDQIDPDVACQPMISTVTQGIAAGGLVTASGIAQPTTNLTLLLSDSFTPQRPFATVLTDAGGHWSTSFHLSSNGVLTAMDPDGTSMSVPIAVVAKVNVSRTRPAGRDRLGHCIDRVDGSTYPFVPGSLVVLRGPQDRQVGFGAVHQLGTIGSWKATVVVSCQVNAVAGKGGTGGTGGTGGRISRGKAKAAGVTTTKATLSGLLPGTAVRFAADGRSVAVKLPLNRTPPKTRR